MTYQNPIPINKKLYSLVTKEAKNKFKIYPSIYYSSWIVREYKKRGGKYKGRNGRNSKGGLSRWYEEKWINICELPNIVTCGREQAHGKNWKKDYPYCRPLYRITKDTPRTATEISASELRKRCSIKQANPLKRLNSTSEIVRKPRHSSKKKLRVSNRKKPRHSSKKKLRHSSKKKLRVSTKKKLRHSSKKKLRVSTKKKLRRNSRNK